jgi:DNA-binding Xre family transcriptional regulator
MAEMNSFYAMQNHYEKSYPSAEDASLQEDSMTAFDFGMTDKEIDGAAGVDIVNRRVIGALIKRLADKSITKGQLAEKLDIHRSQVSKLLRGDQNLTARTIGEILGALDFDFDVCLEDRRSSNGNNMVETANLWVTFTVMQSTHPDQCPTTSATAAQQYRATNSAQAIYPATKRSR